MTVEFNGREYDDETASKAMAVMQHRLAGNDASANSRPGVGAGGDMYGTGPDIFTETELRSRMGKQYGGKRDIYSVLGYDTEVEVEAYRTKFRRQDIANRIVQLPARDTWRRGPDVIDGDPDADDDGEDDPTTPFTDALDRIVRGQRLYHYCKRADVAAGIGEYGLLFVGYADGRELDRDVDDAMLSDPDDVAYLTPFSQDAVEHWTLGREAGLDPSHPRYNKPVEYDIDFGDVDEESRRDTIRTVHWERVIHIAEGLVESDLKGTPRLRPVYNRLMDLEKVAGASAEMFWTGADRKFHFNIDTDAAADVDPNALDDMDEEVQKLVHDMEPYVKTFNTDVEVIGGQEVDPSGVIDELLKFISGATGIPKRILTGSERGELASTQDRANWYGKIEARQQNFATPVILRPIIDRWIEFGILPTPANGSYEVEWPSLFELTDLESAEIQSTRAQALNSAAPGGNTDVLATPEDIMAYVIDGERPEFDEAGMPPMDEEEFDVPGDAAADQFDADFPDPAEMSEGTPAEGDASEADD